MSSAASVPPKPLCGIGLVLEDGPDGPVVRSLNPLGAAAISKADILPNDLLLSVDGCPTATCDAIKARVPGPEGSAVTLGLKRGGAHVSVVVVRAPVRSSAPAPAPAPAPASAPVSRLSPSPSFKSLSAESPPFNPSSSPAAPSLLNLNAAAPASKLTPPSSFKSLSAASPPFNPSSCPAPPSLLNLNSSPPLRSASPPLNSSASVFTPLLAPPPPSVYIDRSLAAAALKRGPVATRYTPQYILSLKPPRAKEAAIAWGLEAMEMLESSMRTLQPIKTK